MVKEITLTTQEKTERMAKKRNMEGTCSTHNMFFVLPIDEIAELTTGMGVNIDVNDFGTFDLLKDLEFTRHDLFVKQKEVNVNSQTEIVGNCESPLPIEWLQDENSDTEDSILVLLKKKAREQKKKVKFSPTISKKT